MSDGFKRFINVLVFGLLFWAILLIPYQLSEYFDELNTAEKKLYAFEFEKKLRADNLPKYRRYDALHTQVYKHMGKEKFYIKKVDIVNLEDEGERKKAIKKDRAYHIYSSYNLRQMVEEENNPELNQIVFPILDEMREIERSEIKKNVRRNQLANYFTQIGLILFLGIFILIFNYIFYGRVILLHKQKK